MPENSVGSVVAVEPLGLIERSRPSHPLPFKPSLVVLSHEDVAILSESTGSGWRAFVGVVYRENHLQGCLEVLRKGSLIPETTARRLFPEFKGVDYDR